jgi:hypothetical protein
LLRGLGFAHKLESIPEQPGWKSGCGNIRRLGTVPNGDRKND